MQGAEEGGDKWPHPPPRATSSTASHHGHLQSTLDAGTEEASRRKIDTARFISTGGASNASALAERGAERAPASTSQPASPRKPIQQPGIDRRRSAPVDSAKNKAAVKEAELKRMAQRSAYDSSQPSAGIGRESTPEPPPLPPEPKEVYVDRHKLFASTVPLQASRHEVTAVQLGPAPPLTASRIGTPRRNFFAGGGSSSRYDGSEPASPCFGRSGFPVYLSVDSSTAPSRKQSEMFAASGMPSRQVSGMSEACLSPSPSRTHTAGSPRKGGGETARYNYSTGFDGAASPCNAELVESGFQFFENFVKQAPPEVTGEAEALSGTVAKMSTPSITSMGTWAPSPPSTARSAKSGCGVPVRPWQLPRQDCIPTRNTGKRSAAARDRQIRLFVRMPGFHGRCAIWVTPDTPVGPPVFHDKTRFTDIWGEDAEMRGPYGNKAAVDARPTTPVRALALKRWSKESDGRQEVSAQSARSPPSSRPVTQGTLGGVSVAEASTTIGSTNQFWSMTGLSSSASSSPHPESLKGLLEQCTGVPCRRQLLVAASGTGGPLLDDDRCLCDYDIGHGALLFLTILPEPGQKPPEPILACKAALDNAIHAHPGADATAILGKLGKLSPRKTPQQQRRSKSTTAAASTSCGSSTSRPSDYALPLASLQKCVEAMPKWFDPDTLPMALEIITDVPIPFDYGMLPDNSIFDKTGRVRKKFGELQRRACVGQSAKRIETASREAAAQDRRRAASAAQAGE